MFNDVRLVRNARNCWVRDIDYSWECYCKDLIKKRPSLPFVNDADYVVRRRKVLVKGWEGRLSIKYIHFGNRMYGIVKPMCQDDFSLWGAWDVKGSFCGMLCKPAFGAHVTEGFYEFYWLCLGDYKMKNPGSYSELCNSCGEIAKVLETINIHSLGSIFLPGRAGEVFLREMPWHEKIELLEREGLINKILE